MSGPRKTLEPDADPDEGKHSGPRKTTRRFNQGGRHSRRSLFNGEEGGNDDNDNDNDSGLKKEKAKQASIEVVAEKFVKDHVFRNDAVDTIRIWLKGADSFSVEDTQRLLGALPDSVFSKLNDRFSHARECFQRMMKSAMEQLSVARRGLLFGTFFEKRYAESESEEARVLCMKDRMKLLNSMTKVELNAVAKELQIEDRVKTKKGKPKLIRVIAECLADRKSGSDVVEMLCGHIPSPLPTVEYLSRLFTNSDARKTEIQRLRDLKNTHRGKPLFIYSFLLLLSN